MITPRTLKGFRDYLPATMMPREQMMNTAREVFRGFGYAPIDTPVLEYFEILGGKGSDETDRQMYRFTDNGGREVGMRFDLTVPLARFVAQHANELGMPFRRYHIAPVYRGENTQRGRYREFVQCDFDLIGTRSEIADIEILCVIDSLMRGLGFEKFRVQMNNREVLGGLLEKLNLSDAAVPVLRCLDKLAKIGRDAVQEEMVSVAGISSEAADQVLHLSECKGDAESVFQRAGELVAGNERGETGIKRLEQVYRGALAAGVDPKRILIDVSIARGLDYYTGVIFETFLDDLPGIGSVCSGGRYDNLAGIYTKQDLPGIGASLGLDRLLAAMEQLELLPSESTPADVLMTVFDADHQDDYLRLAAQLRQAGVKVELYPEAKKIKAQLKYASSKGFAIAIMAGETEWNEGVVQVKDLNQREEAKVAYDGENVEAVVAEIKRILNSNSATA